MGGTTGWQVQAHTCNSYIPDNQAKDTTLKQEGGGG